MYDLCGNRLKKLDKNGTEEYHYNRKNQLICRFSEREKTSYHYGRQGNLLEAAGAEGTTVFSYNAFHQQLSVAMPHGKHLENWYDVEYLRAGTVENGTITTFSHHNGELLAESSLNGDTISRYIPGYEVAAGWNREKSGYHYYHLDEQNSTAYITGSGGEIENRYEYDAFGVLKNSSEELPNRIFYTEQQYDQTSGQYYLRARFYNPVLGRFVQEDVYRGDGMNLYAYCKNNPVVCYDPSGFGRSPIDYTKIPQKDWSERAITTNRVTGSPNIPTKKENFKNWFDNLTSDQLEELYKSQDTKDYIKDRLRGEGKQHEWNMVCNADRLKKTGLTASDIMDNVTPIEKIRFIEILNPHTGEKISGGHTRTSAGRYEHIELDRLYKEVLVIANM